MNDSAKGKLVFTIAGLALIGSLIINLAGSTSPTSKPKAIYATNPPKSGQPIKLPQTPPRPQQLQGEIAYSYPPSQTNPTGQTSTPPTDQVHH